MAIRLSTADEVLSRLWRPGHPFRDRCSRKRQWGMGILLIVLLAVIVTYWILTNPRRVRAMCQDYLTGLVGAPVQIEKASLSVFEGLKLRGVRVYVEKVSPDDLIFSANNIELQYRPQSLFRGKIQATRLIATSPIVRMVEDAETGKWNYMRLRRKPQKPRIQVPSDEPAPQQAPAPPEALPEIVVRDAQVEYVEERGSTRRPMGRVTIEGLFKPEPTGSLARFELQTRGQSGGIGPHASGAYDMDSGQVQAELHNLEFGRDVAAMLPNQVRNWWIEHRVNGLVNLPSVQFDPSGGKKSFRVVTTFEKIGLTLDPKQWLSPKQVKSEKIVGENLDWLAVNAPVVADMGRFLRKSFDLQLITLTRADGSIIFTQDGIEIPELIANIESNSFRVAGKIDGYSVDAPIDVTVGSSTGKTLNIPVSPGYVNSMPSQVRDIYSLLRPSGVCTAWLRVRRAGPTARTEVSGEVDILNGSFTYGNFPYPLRSANGKLILNVETESGIDKLDIVNLTGKGPAGGPNEDNDISVSGWVGPFDERVGTDITIVGTKMKSERALRAAFSAETRRVLSKFDPDGSGEYPIFSGDFVCRVVCPIGIKTITSVVTEINLTDAQGKLSAFPYPLSGVHGVLVVGDDQLTLKGMTMQRGNMRMHVDGTIATRTENGVVDYRPNIIFDVHDVPIDNDLIGAIPKNHRKWLEKIGLTGVLDINGRLIPENAGRTTGVDMTLRLRDGSMLPVEGKPLLTNTSAKVQVLTTKLIAEHIEARKGDGYLEGSGSVSWESETPKFDFKASASRMELDNALREALPEKVRNWWDQIHPRGSVSLDAVYRTLAPGASKESEFTLNLRPEKLSVRPEAVPYELTDLSGSLVISSQGVTLNDMSAKHGAGVLHVSGGNTAGAWEIKGAAENLAIDEDLVKGLPKAIGDVLQAGKFSGHVTFDAPKIVYRPATTQSASEVHLAAHLETKDLSSNSAIRFSDLNGTADVAVIAQNGSLQSLAGKLNIDSLKVAERSMKNLVAQIEKKADKDIVRIEKISADIGGGEIAGQIDLGIGGDKVSSYGLNLVLRNADIREVAKLSSKDFQGQVSASLSLEGFWNDPSSRRGRGDVLVNGKELYHMPVLLGAMEIANLAIPISSPFSEGSSRYSVDGQRVTFESVELKSANMVMTGSGYLDFAKRSVRMNFTTDNPNWPKVPFLSELVQNARKELMQIQVRGTIQDPKVTASPMNTFTTTVDEVLKGAGDGK